MLPAFGVGLEKQMRKNARGIGDGLAILFPGTTTLPFQGFPEGRRIRLLESDGALIEREVRGVDYATPTASGAPCAGGRTRPTRSSPGRGREYEELRYVLPPAAPPSSIPSSPCGTNRDTDRDHTEGAEDTERGFHPLCVLHVPCVIPVFQAWEASQSLASSSSSNVLMLRLLKRMTAW